MLVSLVGFGLDVAARGALGGIAPAPRREVRAPGAYAKLMAAIDQAEKTGRLAAERRKLAQRRALAGGRS